MSTSAVVTSTTSMVPTRCPSTLTMEARRAAEGLLGDGFGEAWSKVADSLDLAGEARACDTLGLGKGCLEDWSTVKRSYRQLALEFHPDKQADATEEQRAAAEARFREVQEAYEHLQKLHSSKKQEAEAARSGEPEP